jgi:hypothetical protein
MCGEISMIGLQGLKPCLSEPQMSRLEPRPTKTIQGIEASTIGVSRSFLAIPGFVGQDFSPDKSG